MLLTLRPLFARSVEPVKCQSQLELVRVKFVAKGPTALVVPQVALAAPRAITLLLLLLQLVRLAALGRKVLLLWAALTVRHVAPVSSAEGVSEPVQAALQEPTVRELETLRLVPNAKPEHLVHQLLVPVLTAKLELIPIQALLHALTA